MYEIMKRNKQDYIYIYYIIRKTVGERERVLFTDLMMIRLAFQKKRTTIL